MPTIRFQNDEIALQARAGSSLAQAAHEAGASIPFGCRAGTCGTCACVVVRGDAYLADRGYVEEDTLRVIGKYGPDRRLACQVILLDADLEIEW